MISVFPGFDYTCSACGAKSSVYTVYRTDHWDCIKCGALIPQEDMIPRGSFPPLTDEEVRSLSRSESPVDRSPKLSPVPSYDFGNLRSRLGK